MAKISIKKIAWKNLGRKVFRSAAIALSVMVVTACVFCVTTIMDSVENSLERSTKRLGADIMVVSEDGAGISTTTLLSGEASIDYIDKGVIEKIKAVEGVKNVAGQLFLRTTSYQCCDAGDLLLIGFNPDDDFTIMPWLQNTLKRPLKDNEAIMGREITAYDVGSMFQAYGQMFTIAGILDQTGMKFIDNSIYLPIKGLAKVVSQSKTKSKAQLDKKLINSVSTVLVQVEPEFDPKRVGIFIEYNVSGVRAIETSRVIASVRKHLFLLLRSMLSITIALWIMALLLIGVVFSMIVNERQREVGLLRAMGARKSNVFSLLIWEASILSLTGGVLGLGLAGGALYFLGEKIKASMNIPFMWPGVFEFSILTAFSLLLALLTGVGAALLPALKSTWTEPYLAIRKGE